MYWYAIFVETGSEDNVKKCLSYHFNRNTLYSVVPKRKLPEKRSGKFYDVFKNLFPGYVLVYTDMNNSTYHLIRSIPKVIKVLRDAIILEEEITPILQLICNNDVIDYSSIHVENSKVFVKSGPLKGMEGIIRKVNPHTKRAKIMLNFLGKPHFIDVGIELLLLEQTSPL